jgi:hypothetical protein
MGVATRQPDASAPAAEAGIEVAATRQPDVPAPASEAGMSVRTAEAGIEVAAPHGTPCDRKARSGLPVSGQCARASGRPTGQDRLSPGRSPGEETRP